MAGALPAAAVPSEVRGVEGGFETRGRCKESCVILPASWLVQLRSTPHSDFYLEA